MYHRQRWIGLLILAALLLCACQPIVAQPQAAAQPSDEDVTAAVTAEIDALFTEYGESLAADDAERWIAAMGRGWCADCRRAHRRISGVT